MTSGSRKSSKVTDLADVKPKAKKSNHEVGKSTALVPPAEAAKDPAKWTEDHITSLMPRAAKRVEYTLMFGSDALAYQAAKDILAIKGMTTKPKDQGLGAPPMVFNFGGQLSQSGVPVLPFSNAAPRLTPGTAVVTIENDGDDTDDDKED